MKVLAFARFLGTRPTHTLIVGCEPATIITGEDYTDMQMGLSELVQAAALETVKMFDSPVGQLLTSTPITLDSSRDNEGKEHESVQMACSGSGHHVWIHGESITARYPALPENAVHVI